MREGAVLGRNCILGKGAYVDFGVQIGDNVKIQNRASVYHGVTIENGVFVGPHVIFTNDRLPRAINPDGSLKSDDDWVLGQILVQGGRLHRRGGYHRGRRDYRPLRDGRLGRGGHQRRARLRPGLRQPGPTAGYVCENGHRLAQAEDAMWKCPICGREVEIDNI